MSKVVVGIVEDEMLIARGIEKSLRELGYTPTSPAVSYTAAVKMIEEEKPDILLLDIVLSGHKDGIDLAWKVKEDYDIPFIFLTANCDAATVERAKKASPPAYLVKPFNKDELYTSIEICLYNFSEIKRLKTSLGKDNFMIKDCLYIKQAQTFIKVKTDEITYLESDNVYIKVNTTSTRIIVRSKLQDYLDLISLKNLFRVHRSFAVNINHIDAINTDSLLVHGREIPIGKSFREELVAQIRMG